MNNTPIWVIRAGRVGEAHELFINRQRIALGRPEIGNLKLLDGTRTSFREAYTKLHESDHPTSIATIASQLFRFVHEMKDEDCVVYPSVKDGKVYFGVVDGGYMFKSDNAPAFPHRRKVRWLGSVEKKSLSAMARNELRAAKSLFQVKRNSAEILALFAPVDNSKGVK
jgi:predicted Mrr-cat superfamily restriction endonuclease